MNKIQACRLVQRFIFYNYTTAIAATHVLQTQATFRQLWDPGLRLLSCLAAVSRNLTVMPRATLTAQKSCVQGRNSRWASIQLTAHVTCLCSYSYSKFIVNNYISINTYIYIHIYIYIYIQYGYINYFFNIYIYRYTDISTDTQIHLQIYTSMSAVPTRTMQQSAAHVHCAKISSQEETGAGFPSDYGQTWCNRWERFFLSSLVQQSSPRTTLIWHEDVGICNIP